METTKSADKRILSVDVLRGFDMFWLVGGTGLALAIVKLCGGAVQDLLLPQLDHADWIGFTFYDLIFPLFEFVMGISVVFSLKKILIREGKLAAYRRLLRRFLLSFVPVPDTGLVALTIQSNWAQYLDALLLPGKKSGGSGTWDVNGLLGTFPATVSCLLGVFAASILQHKKFTDKKRLIRRYLWVRSGL